MRDWRCSHVDSTRVARINEAEADALDAVLQLVELTERLEQDQLRTAGSLIEEWATSYENEASSRRHIEAQLHNIKNKEKDALAAMIEADRQRIIALTRAEQAEARTVVLEDRLSRERRLLHRESFEREREEMSAREALNFRAQSLARELEDERLHKAAAEERMRQFSEWARKENAARVEYERIVQSLQNTSLTESSKRRHTEKRAKELLSVVENERLRRRQAEDEAQRLSQHRAQESKRMRAMGLRMRAAESQRALDQAALAQVDSVRRWAAELAHEYGSLAADHMALRTAIAEADEGMGSLMNTSMDVLSAASPAPSPAPTRRTEEQLPLYLKWVR